jgi:putative transposase
MRSRKNDLVTARQVEDLASSILQRSLQWVDVGTKCTAVVVLRVLFFAAARTASIFDACRHLANAPCDQAVRNALFGWLGSDMPELERRLNRALRAKLSKGLFRRRRWPMAADTSEIGYYGRPWRRTRELRRGKRKAGTTRFHCYATLYVVAHGQRFTVALTYVWKDDTNLTALVRLLRYAAQIGLHPRYLLLDRGFYSLPVVQYLQAARYAFLMPVIHRGKKSKRPLQQLRGTRRFLAWKRGGWATHVMDNRKTRRSVRVCVSFPRRQGQSRQSPQRRKRRRRERGRPLVYIYWGFRPASPAWVREHYRRRYGIESSYRQMNQARARTCSRKPVLRLLLVGIALVLRNVWVWLHHQMLGRIRGRSIELHLEQLRLRTMLLMLQHCIEACVGCSESGHPPEIPPLGSTTGPPV